MSRTVPFYKPSIGEAEIAAVVECLRSGWLTTGPRTREFERDFGAYVRQKHSLALNSCTAALHLALEAIGLKAEESVLVPTMTFAATAEVVRYFGAKPILVDCREEDFNLDPLELRRRTVEAVEAGEQPKAVIPVHYGGQVGDVHAVAALAKAHDLRIIEDAAHCCPAYYRDDEQEPWKPVGAGADVTCFSFYANKTITTGEGGMACTSVDELADRMRVMSLHGISKDAWKRFTAEGSWYYEIVAPGFKYNLTDIASAIGIHQLSKADELHRRRAERVGFYKEELAGVDEVILPTQLPNRIHSWHLYVIRLRLERLSIDRAQLIEELKRLGITTSVHWMPLHMHPYYRQRYGYRPEDFPVAARLFKEIVTLPLFPDMTRDDVTYVCNALKGIIAKNLRGAPCGS